mgnify:CR=1 FL=1
MPVSTIPEPPAPPDTPAVCETPEEPTDVTLGIINSPVEPQGS